MWLNFLYTVQLVISDVCIKFQNSKSGSSLEFFDEKFNTHYIGVRDRKIEEEGQNKSQHLVFVFSNTFGCPDHVYKI